VSQAQAILPDVAAIIRNLFNANGVEIGFETTAPDIDGWDSVSHTFLVLSIEERFGVTFPIDKVHDMENVGDLCRILAGLLEGRA